MNGNKELVPEERDDCQPTDRYACHADGQYASNALTEQTQEEREYYQTIDRCARNADDQYISNALPDHAVYLMAKLISLASKKVFLYTGRLKMEVSATCGEGEIITTPVYNAPKIHDALLSFLCRADKKAIIHILVEKEIDGGENNPIFKILQNAINSSKSEASIQIRSLDPKSRDEDVIDNHFLVVDDRAYRLELDHDPCKAVANFGDVSGAKKLSEYFKTVLFPLGKPILPDQAT